MIYNIYTVRSLLCLISIPYRIYNTNSLIQCLEAQCQILYSTQAQIQKFFKGGRGLRRKILKEKCLLIHVSTREHIKTRQTCNSFSLLPFQEETPWPPSRSANVNVKGKQQMQYIRNSKILVSALSINGTSLGILCIFSICFDLLQLCVTGLH